MQPHNFLSTDAAGGTPTRRHALGRLPTPPPLPENLLLRLHRKLPSVPPASTQEVSESEVPVHVPLRRPRPFRFDRKRTRLNSSHVASPHAAACSKVLKVGERKVAPNLSNFFCSDAADHTPPRPFPTRRSSDLAPSARKSATQTAQKTALCASCEHPGGFGIRGSRSRTASPPASLPI